MFLFDILIYVFFAFVMYKYARKSYVYSLQNKVASKADFNLWMFWCFFAVICGIRWNVGNDSVGYMMDFDKGNVREDSVEYLWDIFVKGVYRLKLHYVFGMAITAFVQIFFSTKIASRYRYILVFLPFVLFGGVHFLDWCNAVRQMMAACIFVYATQFILKKKLWPYVLCIFAASLIHHSAQLLYVFYVFAYISPQKISISDKKLISVSIFIVCFVLGLTPQFKSFVGMFNILVESFGTYGYVGDVIEKTIIEGENEVKNFGPMQLSYFLTALATVWYGPNLKNKYQNVLPYFDLWWFFSFVYGCGYFLFCNVSFMFTRPLGYFQPFQMLITSLLLWFFFSTKKKVLFYGLITTLWASLICNIFKNYGEPWESVTYKLFLFHDLYKWMN